MLHLILGRAGFGKTCYMNQQIQELPDHSSAILLVPEQYSFFSERSVLDVPYEKRPEVLSFSRLCHSVFRQYGGLAGSLLSEEEKLMLMTRAVSQLMDQLKVFRRQAKNPRFVQHLLSVITECGYAGVDARQLFQAAQQLPSAGLLQKVTEISMIFEAYQALVRESYLDPLEEERRAHSLLQNSEYWTGKTVFVDSFKGFTVPQKALLEQMIASAKDVYISLCTDGLPIQHNLELFANTKSLAGELIRMANRHGIPMAAPVVLTENRRAKNPSLAAAEAVLTGQTPLPEETGHPVIICACEDRYDEAEFVAAHIQRLVQEEGFRYRDIAVIARDFTAYEEVVEEAFDRYHIPYFSDSRRRVTDQPIMAFAAKAVELCTKGLESSGLLSLLKTGCTKLTYEQIALLENYVFTWNLSGKAWCEPFVQNPAGAGMEPPDVARLEELNVLRKQVIDPVLQLKERLLMATSARGMAGALYGFLEKNQSYRQLLAMAKLLEQAGNGFEAEDVLRSFQRLNDLLDHLVTAMGDTPLTGKDFCDLLMLSMEAADMGKIPQGLDQVTVGSADRTRPGQPLAVFLVGVNQGVFPAVPSSGGVLTDRERQALNQVDIPLSEHGAFDTVEERFLFYSCACCASDRLYISYRTTDGEKVLSPSDGVEALIAAGCVATTWETLVEKDPLLLCSAEEPAFDLLAKQYHAGTPLAGSLYAFFQEYAPQKLSILQRLTKPVDCTVSSDNAKGIFGERMFVSPTGIETYHKCAFSYFCRYGLRIQPRKTVALDVLTKGTLVHYVLEQMLRRHGSKGLYTLGKEQLQSHVHTLLLDYVERAMGGLSQKAYVFRFQLERIEVLLVSLLLHMAAEMKESCFETVACELQIGPDGPVSALSIPLPEGGSLSVVGVVDRVDVYEKDGVTYFRVVDYKTGSKSFNLEDVYYGIGLQMLLYLYAIEKNGTAFGQHRTPAGVLYMPARRLSIKEEGNAKTIEKELAKTMKMKGLVLDDAAVIHAMDPTGEGLYMPFSFKKDGTVSADRSLASIEFFGKTRKQIESLLAQMGETLQKGAIACQPLDPIGGNACQYCDYRAACPLPSTRPHQKVPAMSAAEERFLLQGGEYHELSANSCSAKGY